LWCPFLQLIFSLIYPTSAPGVQSGYTSVRSTRRIYARRPSANQLSSEFQIYHKRIHKTRFISSKSHSRPLMNVDQTQELEIEALKAIYGEDFQDAPPSKVWKVRNQLFPPSLAGMPPATAAHFPCRPVSLMPSLGCCHIP
jgi:hypothetical protein